MDPSPVPAKTLRWRRLAAFAAVAAVGLAAGVVADDEYVPLPVDVRFLLMVIVVGLMAVLAALFVPRTWTGRLAALLALAAPFGALAAVTRKVEFDGAGRPRRLTFLWDREPPAALGAAPAGATNNEPSGASAAMPRGSAAKPLRLALDPNDSYPQYRGPERDGKSPGPALAANWSAAPPKLLWKHPCGGGYGAFAAVGEALFTLEQRGPNEAVVCYRRDDGAEVWRHEYPARFEESMGGPGPRTTPTFDDGKLYSFGALGDLCCLDAATGKVIWTKNPLKELGASNLAWAMSGSPLVAEAAGRKLVVVNPGVAKFPKDGDRGGVAAYDSKNGELVWTSKPAVQAGYASPVLTTLAGAPTVLVFDGQGLAGLDPATGAERFRHKYETNQGINVAQPLPLGDGRVLIAASYLMGCATVKVSRAGEQWNAEQQWRQRRAMQCKFTTPIVHEGHAYGVNDTRLQCLDLATGASKWKGADVGYGQVVARGGLLLALGEDGRVRLVRLTPERYEELGVLEDFKHPRVWNTPTLAGRVLYLRNHEEMAAYQLPLAP